MAAVSAPHAPSALTPPSSSHGGATSWNYTVPAQTETSKQSTVNDPSRPPLTSQTNGYSLNHQSSRSDLSQKRKDPHNSSRSADSGYLAPTRINALTRKESSISDAGSAADSLLDLYGPTRSGVKGGDVGEMKNSGGGIYADDEDPEGSRWIHRDKLARIENLELQEAGIILPRARAASKSSRREHSRDQQGNGFRSELAGQKLPPVESYPAEEEPSQEDMGWDLRTPEESAQDPGDMFLDISGGVKGVSRIPVCKTSPIPIPMEHLERDTPIRWQKTGTWSGEDEALSVSKSRDHGEGSVDTTTPTIGKRRASENSPSKKAPGARKGPPSAHRAASAPQGAKSKPGSNRDAPGQRPPTRPGDVGRTNSVKVPEGDPPWVSSMFKPDPRLPPDQQLLPTVAKRLQQEQWEKEGKFGNAYDTSFRPLNDEEFQQPEIVTQTIEVAEQKTEESHGSEWPLKGPKSPALSTGSRGTIGAYSTMPKIVGTPQGVGSLRSPTVVPMWTEEPPAETNNARGGCGCCTVM